MFGEGFACVANPIQVRAAVALMFLLLAKALMVKSCFNPIVISRRIEPY